MLFDKLLDITFDHSKRALFGVVFPYNLNKQADVKKINNFIEKELVFNTKEFDSAFKLFTSKNSLNDLNETGKKIISLSRYEKFI